MIYNLGSALREDAAPLLPEDWFWAWAACFKPILTENLALKYQQPVSDLTISASLILLEDLPWEDAAALVTGLDESSAVFQYLQALPSFDAVLVEGLRWVAQKDLVITMLQAEGVTRLMALLEVYQGSFSFSNTKSVGNYRRMFSTLSTVAETAAIHLGVRDNLDSLFESNSPKVLALFLAGHTSKFLLKDFTVPFWKVLGVDSDWEVSVFNRFNASQQSLFFKMLPAIGELSSLSEDDITDTVHSTLGLVQAL